MKNADKLKLAFVAVLATRALVHPPEAHAQPSCMWGGFLSGACGDSCGGATWDYIASYDCCNPYVGCYGYTITTPCGCIGT
jgi:hypothetical protein